jgi:hypothetical protein
MATVQEFIDSARYDLRDYQKGLEFDDDELLEYVNRMRLSLDSMLTALNSSYVHDEGTIPLLSGSNQVNARTTLNSGNWDSIRDIWVIKDRLEKISVDLMFYKRIFVSGSARPQFWSLRGDYVLVEYPADQNYDLIVRYNKRTPVLVLTDSMPYSSVFNETFRELLVMHAKAKKEGVIAPTEQTYTALFRQIAIQQQIRADRKEKYYHLGF